MCKIYNYNQTPQKKEECTIQEYSWSTTENLSKLSNLKDFSLNIRTLEEGQLSCPYHYHHNAEEVFIIISGNGELRSPKGVRKVEKGDIALFEKGKLGAHQLFNPNSTPLIYIDLKTNHELDICQYPDTGKVNILPDREIFYKGNEVDYYEAEENIKKIWDNLKIKK